MGEEGLSPSNDTRQDEAPAAQQSEESDGGTARYEVGPGFEIAIRAALNRPVEVHLKNEGEGPKPTLRSADADHRHETVEKRLDSIERALLIMVDQLKRIDDQLAGRHAHP